VVSRRLQPEPSTESVSASGSKLFARCVRPTSRDGLFVARGTCEIPDGPHVDSAQASRYSRSPEDAALRSFSGGRARNSSMLSTGRPGPIPRSEPAAPSKTQQAASHSSYRASLYQARCIRELPLLLILFIFCRHPMTLHMGVWELPEAAARVIGPNPAATQASSTSSLTRRMGSLMKHMGSLTRCMGSLMGPIMG
jgi:hypothetical protein